MKSLPAVSFPIVSVFVALQAIVSVWAFGPEDVKFYLWTLDGNGNAVPEHPLKVSDAQSLQDASFDPSQKIEIYIHGWRNTGQDKYAKNYAKAFLDAREKNVITVDWQPLSKSLLYPIVANHVPMIGDRTAEMIETMLDVGADINQIHIAGHSLGAHISGRAGGKLQQDGRGSLGRITGMDPAGGPPFDGNDPNVRLDKENAQFVDIIHTNGGSFGPLSTILNQYGLLKPIGHADFYPNGGQNQPGCNPFINNFVFTGFCSHLKSIDYFVNSVSSTDAYRACPCEDWKNADKCAATCSDPIAMGEPLDNASGTYYVDTTSS